MRKLTEPPRNLKTNKETGQMDIHFDFEGRSGISGLTLFVKWK